MFLKILFTLQFSTMILGVIIGFIYMSQLIEKYEEQLYKTSLSLLFTSLLLLLIALIDIIWF